MSKIERFVEGLSGKPVLVYGLGRSGSSSAKVLADAGVEVVIGDDNPENIQNLADLNLKSLEDVNYHLSDYAFLLLSPGIPLTHPKPHDIVNRAKAADIEIICDLELFHRVYPDLKTIGVTGTNGKSTTTALLNHIFQTSGISSLLGGNIGIPVFDLEIKDEDAWVILEMSSFQIDLCPTFRPDISVVLNITPDHLDRHGDIDHYTEVKERITEIVKEGDYNAAVICTDDKYTRKIYTRAEELKLRNVVETSTLESVTYGVFIKDDTLFDAMESDVFEVGNLEKIQSLSGVHNYQNAASTYAAARIAGLAHEKIWTAMEAFAGLNHRQYLVRTINGVPYINDSKATNAASAAVALACRDNIYWIVGGRKKHTGLDGLEEFFGNINHAFLIGESTDDFAKWFENYNLAYSKCFTLDKALGMAHDMAQEHRGKPGGGAVVLLSPACASFDQFASFEDRGNRFSELVEKLDQEK